jgi:predicted DsbA family dithiol-disulfide isomerase
MISLAAGMSAQKPDEVLATAAGQTFTTKDLPARIAKIWENEPAMIAESRTRTLSEMMTTYLLETEAKAQNITVQKLVENVTAKVPEPRAAEIQALYDSNRSQIGSKTLEEIRPQLVEFLRREPEQKAIQDYLKTLEVKYNLRFTKDVNSPDLKSLDAVATMTGRSISAQEFEVHARSAAADIKADIYSELKYNLDALIYPLLLSTEAKSLGIDTGDLLAREVTNKMRDYSDSERLGLQAALQRRLFAKYGVKYLLKEPEPFVQNISTDDDPAQGKPGAPVTIVMFSDFQCSVCSATHPILKKVISEFGDKVRFVVRDFPLTQVHENAFQSALAANAAYAQGKFFEYTEILYRNQDALDSASLKKYAADVGLNPKQFELDLASEKNAAEVRKDVADGNTYGVFGTPTIFVNGVKVRQLSAEGFRDAIERALKK